MEAAFDLTGNNQVDPVRQSWLVLVHGDLSRTGAGSNPKGAP
jgi:hypothetical protein